MGGVTKKILIELMKDEIDALKKTVFKLEDENERLKQENIELHETAHKVDAERRETIGRLQQAVAEREEALRKCSPYENDFGDECSDCEQLIVEKTYCRFCGVDFLEKHAADCEYVRLIGGRE